MAMVNQEPPEPAAAHPADALSQTLSDVNTGTRAAKESRNRGTWSIELRTIGVAK